LYEFADVDWEGLEFQTFFLLLQKTFHNQLNHSITKRQSLILFTQLKPAKIHLPHFREVSFHSEYIFRGHRLGRSDRNPLFLIVPLQIAGLIVPVDIFTYLPLKTDQLLWALALR
jgi:hypothetical protein